MALREDYKDDILDISKNEKRKYNMTTNSDGTVSFEDVTEYSQVGDSFGGADVNAITTVVNQVSFTEVFGVLTAGETEVVLSDASITEDSTVEPFASVYNVNPSNMVVADGSVTLTFDAMEEDLSVKVRVW